MSLMYENKGVPFRAFALASRLFRAAHNYLKKTTLLTDDKIFC